MSEKTVESQNEEKPVVEKPKRVRHGVALDPKVRGADAPKEKK